LSRSPFLLLFVALVGASIAVAQTERLIKLDIVATNARGEPVTDLKASDIQVREDGKPQRIVFFDPPGSTPVLAPSATGEFMNRREPIPTLILFDRWNERILTSDSSWMDISAALEGLESVERIYIYFLTNRGELFPVHPLPGTDADLGNAPRPSPSQLRALLDDAVRRLQGFRDIDAQDSFLRANTTFQALGALGARMASIAGPKNLIWVTHGVPLSVPVPGRDWVDLTPQIRALSAGSVQSQIAIYTVDQSGQGAGAPVDSSSGITLQMFASLTGGRWYTSGDTRRALAEAMRDSRGLYRIAYYSAIREKERKEHKIRLESSQKGVRLLTVEGYFGDAVESDPEQLEQEAFGGEQRSPFDADEIGLRVEPLRNASGKITHLKIHVNPTDILIDHDGSKYRGRVSVMTVYYRDGFLEHAADTARADIVLTPEQYSQATQQWITVPVEVTLDSEVQKMRVMVFDRGTHGLGSVTLVAK
jgi:VWFA-related protein